MVNPTWQEREGMQLEEEGCLSLPGFTATVPRPARASVRGLNRQGEEHVVEGPSSSPAHCNTRWIISTGVCSWIASAASSGI